MDTNTRSAIKAKCRDCVGCTGVEYALVEKCDGKCVGVEEIVGTEVCPLHPHRMKSNGSDGKRLKAIRLHCLWCMGGTGWANTQMVKECDDSTCALWKFRFGKNPNKFGRMSDEQKAKLSARMKEMMAKRKITKETI